MAGKRQPAWVAQARSVGGSGRVPLIGPILPPDPQDDVGVDSPAALRALNERLARLEHENKTLKRQRRGAMFAPQTAQNPQQAGQPQVPLHPQRVEIDPTTLPDPYVDPKGYAAAVAKGVQAGIDAREAVTARQRQEAEAQAAEANRVKAGVDAVWAKFRKAHPEFEGMDDLVHLAANEIVQEGVALGATAKDIVFGHTEEFMEEVAERMKDRAEELGIDVEKRQEARNAPAEPAERPLEGIEQLFGRTIGNRQPQEADDEPGNRVDSARTATIEGGSRGVAPSGRAAEEKPTTFVEELKGMQRRTGLF